MDPGGDAEKRDVRRPMNAFLIFCKRHRSIVREKNPDLDNRSVTRILGDLWANLKEQEKVVYTDLAKQYKDAFMKANPDYKWHNPEKTATNQKVAMPKPTNVKVIRNDLEVLTEGSIMPGKLADPSNMGGLSLLLIAGQQSEKDPGPTTQTSPVPMETRESDTDPVSPPIGKVKWDEEKFSRSFSGDSATHRHRNDSSLKTDHHGTKESLPQTSTCESGGLGSETMMAQMNFKSDTSRWTNLKEVVPATDPAITILSKPESKVESGEPVWRIENKKWENHSKPSTQTWKIDSLAKEKEAASQSLLALTESQPLSALATEQPSKPLLYQAVAAPKVPPRSLLAEAFRDTCEKGNYPDILRDNSVVAKKTNAEDNLKCPENMIEKFDSRSEFDEKENISKLLVQDVKDSKENGDEESPMITCGKLVVNHIIDKLFSSDIAAAARKANSYSTDKMEGKGSCVHQMEAVHLQTTVTESAPPISVPKRTTTCINSDSVHGQDNAAVNMCSKNDKADFDEHDGVKVMHGKNGPGSVPMVTDDSSCDEHSVNDMSACKVSEQMEVDNISDTNKQEKAASSPPTNCASPPQGGREEEVEGEGEVEDGEDYQPVRKSRRRNRGQRYQELINEGIIQPSKERMAALKQDTPKEDCPEEDFQSIDSYILPETAIRRIRKRTTSESAKDKILPLDDAKRYKTGDFDLEAHIATLPACPVESMGRKRGFLRQRHHSESTHIKKQFEEPQMPVFDIKKAVSLPPHVKIQSPEKTSEPVVGSRKRKARKHSITHLLPAPPTLIANGNEDNKVNTAGESETSSGKVSGQIDDNTEAGSAVPKDDPDSLLENTGTVSRMDNKNQTGISEEQENKVEATGAKGSESEQSTAMPGHNSSEIEVDSDSKADPTGTNVHSEKESEVGKDKIGASQMKNKVVETDTGMKKDQRQMVVKTGDGSEGMQTDSVAGNPSDADQNQSGTLANNCGDQSRNKQGGHGPPTHTKQNCSAESTKTSSTGCLDTPCLNQSNSKIRDKDVNFNTKVHC